MAFQLSPQGQELQARFVASYADKLHDEVRDKLKLPEFKPIQRPAPRQLSGGTGPSVATPSGAISAATVIEHAQGISDEVQANQARGKRAIQRDQAGLDDATRSAQGATHQTSDDAKKW